jgi:hypothetical protein
MREGLALPEFGYLPFDHFVVVSAPRSSIHICENKPMLSSLFAQANWDTTSSLSKNEQKRILVEKWIALGKYGRNVSIYPPTHSFNDHHPLTKLPGLGPRHVR